MPNAIEEALQEVKPNSEIDPNLMVLASMFDTMKMKAQTVDRFLSTDDLKTQLSPSERKIFSILQQLAINPFPNMIKNSPNIKRKDFESQTLKSFIEEYLRLGIAVDRKGRKEDLQAVQSLTSSDDRIMLGRNGGSGGGGLIG